MSAFVLAAEQQHNESNTMDFSDMLQMSREEINGLTMIESEYRESNPIKMTYDNICVHEFQTDMYANPLPIFHAVLDFAHPIINKAVNALDANVVEKHGDNWTVHTNFLSMTICLHCYTSYDQTESAFEDIATHRVVVSIVANFNTKFIYQSDERNGDVFGKINQFYAQLGSSLTEA